MKGKGAVPALADCCGRFIEQGQLPPDALHLMRSRYTAFVLENEAYLLRTWQAAFRPTSLAFEAGAKWLGLGLWGGLLAVLLFTWGPLVWQEPATESTPKVASSSEWQSWSEDKVQTALKQGRPVFIDFTAAWCVTCQVNKQTTLRNPQVLKAFAEKNVLLLRADWTRRDPAITQALGRLGRSGVPVYVLQSPDQPAQVLSEVLSPELMRQALSLIPLPQ